MPNIFTLDNYRSLITALIAQGYEIRGFDDGAPEQRHLILRHDIDQSLQAATQLAALEATEGWLATYFVLVRSEMYNPFSRAGLEALQGILAGGHKIGLHFDAALYADDLDVLEAAVARECALLEFLIERPVTIISFHRPPASLIPCDRILAGRSNTYETRFFNAIGYCSDSRGEWRHGHPLEHAVLAEGRALQLLTHAIWWIGKGTMPRQKLNAFLDRRFSLLENELAANCAVHTPRKLKERM